MGFRDLCKFNIALLAKQGWLFLVNPNTTFWNAQLRAYPSYVWRSIFAARKLLEDGVCWSVGSSINISIWRDDWLPSWAWGRI